MSEFIPIFFTSECSFRTRRHIAGLELDIAKPVKIKSSALPHVITEFHAERDRVKKIYLDEKIFENEDTELKTGYLNINGLVDGSEFL